jgi:hypothetical protein
VATVDDGKGPERLRRLRVAVYDFVPHDVEPRIAKVVSEAVVVELRKLDGLAVVSLEEVRNMLDLEADKAALGCSDDDSCLADVADALGVDGLVTGDLTHTGTETSFTMRRIDQREARTVGSVSRRLKPANGEEFLAVVGESVAELFPELPLRPGQTRGVDPKVGALLNPPPLPTWVLYSTAGVGGAVLASSALVGAGALVAMIDFQLTVGSAGEGPGVSGALVRDKQLATLGLAGLANALVVAAAGVGVASLVLIPFTDWDDNRARGRE